MSSSTLNTSNPMYITWKHHDIRITILGGIMMEGLDRLRVTLKIEHKQAIVRSSLDLYNDGQVEKLVRKTAEHFSLGSAYISKMLEELTNAVESYRITALQKLEVKKPTKVLTPEEKEQAIAFLQEPWLLFRTNELIGKSGIVGEENNRLLMYLIFTSRKRLNPLHVISFAASGTGKSYLQERVGELIPEEDKIEITVLSENAFYYFAPKELRHKLIMIEDMEGAQEVLYPLRELQSKNRLTKRVVVKDKNGTTQTIDVTVEGPVCVAGCTTQESVYEDNANRSFLLYLDESKEQDERIMQRQKQVSAGVVDYVRENKIKTLLKNCQRLLNPISVRNAYALGLTIPPEVIKIRRAHAQYLHFIEAITFYKQYQRQSKVDPQTGDRYIETTLEDIAEANELMKQVLLRKSDELTHAARQYLECIKEYLRKDEKTVFTTKEIRQVYKLHPSNQKRYMLLLLQAGYIRKAEDKAFSFAYEVTSNDEYTSLQDRVKHTLDNSLTRLQEEFNSSATVQKANEPPKSSVTKPSTKKFKSSLKKT